MAEHATHSIPISTFDSYTENFADWVALFEDAVVLATNAPEDRKSDLFKMWLPLKLDTRSHNLYKNCSIEADTTWEAIKTELAALLIDPQEKYNWQINRTTVLWDGKESFHILANKIKRLVDLYDEGANKEKEYFFRFRQALPANYRSAIDLGCDETKRTIDEAKKMAFRFQMAQADTNPPDSSERVGPKPFASFTAASMYEDRIDSLEREMGKLFTRISKLENEKCGHCGKNPLREPTEVEDNDDSDDDGKDDDERYDKDCQPLTPSHHGENDSWFDKYDNVRCHKKNDSQKNARYDNHRRSSSDSEDDCRTDRNYHRRDNEGRSDGYYSYRRQAKDCKQRQSTPHSRQTNSNEHGYQRKEYYGNKSERSPSSRSSRR